MADEVRMIDANSVCKKIVESIRHAEEWANEAKERQDTHGLRCATEAKTSLLAMLTRIHDEPTIEAQPVAKTDARPIELSQLLEDYGFEDVDTLRFVLEQYQKVIVEITHGRLSKLTYPADTIVNMEEDVSREYWEKELVKQGHWRNDKVAFMLMCSECGCCVDQSHDYNFCPSCGCYMRADGDAE